MQSLTDAEKTRLEKYVREYKALTVQGLSKNRWKKEKFLLEIYDLLLKMLSLSRFQSNDTQGDECENHTDDLSNGETFRMTAFNLALTNSLKNYDPNKGSFLNWFWRKYHDAERENWKTEKNPQGRLEVVGSAVRVYETPDSNSKILCSLKEGRKCIVSVIEPEEDSVVQGRWYQLHFKLRKVPYTGYVQDTPDVSYLAYSKESLYGQDEDGDVYVKPIEDTDVEDEEDRLRREELLKYTMFAEFLAFHKAGAARTTSGGLSKNKYYHMFFTEDIICTLQTARHLANGSYPHETLIIQNMEDSWKDHLLVRPCGSFREIAVTPMHTYHELCGDHDHREIGISLENGVEICIREPFMRKEYGVTQDHNGLKVSVSRNRTSYCQDRMQYTKAIMEEPMDKLAELYYEASPN